MFGYPCTEMEDLTANLCWQLVKKEGYITMWQKRLNNSCSRLVVVLGLNHICVMKKISQMTFEPFDVVFAVVYAVVFAVVFAEVAGVVQPFAALFAAFVLVSGFLSNPYQDRVLTYKYSVLTATQETSVIKLQVGLLGMARSLQRDLDRIAEVADTSTSEGLSYVLTAFDTPFST